jgi:ferredoxin
MVTLLSQKMGIHEWSYDNDVSNDHRFKVPIKENKISLKDIKVEVELGLIPSLHLQRPSAASTAMCKRLFTTKLCIECDACVDICPMDCINFTDNGEEQD